MEEEKFKEICIILDYLTEATEINKEILKGLKHVKNCLDQDNEQQQNWIKDLGSSISLAHNDVSDARELILNMFPKEDNLKNEYDEYLVMKKLRGYGY